MKKIGSNMEVENKKGIGLMALVAIIVSGAIGGGVFNLSNDLANGATPGGVVISWLFIGFGILMLVLSLNHLVVNKPELSGVSDYARAGFGDFAGFASFPADEFIIITRVLKKNRIFFDKLLKFLVIS